jgi:hypothetical protein
VAFAAPVSVNVVPLPAVAGFIVPEIVKLNVLNELPPLFPRLPFESVEVTW